MTTRETIRWAADAGGDRVLEFVQVRQLNANQAGNMLALLDARIAQAAAGLAAMRTQRAELAGLLAAGADPPVTKEG